MQRCFRFVFGLALVTGVTMVPSNAAAERIDFLGVAHAATVSIGGIRSGTFWAGEMNWQWIGTAPAGFAQSFYSYCVDVGHNLSDPETVTVRSSTGFTNGVVDGGAKAAWLVNQYAAGIRATSIATQANTLAAALQVAIWEAMYDSTANLATGSFRLTNGSLTSTVRTQADTYLTALYTASGTAYNTSVATILDVVSPNSGQDQIVARVSEPSTLLLMGVALLLFARRIRRSNAPIAHS